MPETPWIQVIRFDDASDLIHYLRPTQAHWGDTVDLDWLFRGHGDADWHLQPKSWRADGQRILRPISRALEPGLKVRWPQIWDLIQSEPGVDNNGEVAFTNVLHSATELEVVYQFASFADELGYPLSPNSLIGGVDYIVSFPGPHGWPRFEPGIEFYFAQHHGIPTRFLDWTRRPLIAAFFAAEDGVKLYHKKCSDTHICIWALNLTFLSISRGKHMLSVETCARHQHSYLHAQDGLFIHHNHANYFYLQNGRWPVFEELIGQAYETGNHAPLRKLMLPSNQAPNLLSLLRRERVTRAHLMPTYDNITATLKNYWGFIGEE